MARRQRTVRRDGEVRGIGLHSGAEAVLRVRPAPPSHGVTFVRTDLPNAPKVPCDVKHLVSRQRRTALQGEAGAEVHTVEHFLACCTALRLDNLLVEISGPECPGMDGSAAEFVQLLDSLGVDEQDAPRAEVVVDSPVAYAQGDESALVAIPGRDGLEVSYTLDYRNAALPPQSVSLKVTEDGFRREIARARTFCLASEAERLRQLDLGKGANYENTLVVGPEGVIGNTLRWQDEFARHKVLDLLGDLFLVGADLRGHVHAYRTGHEANVGLVRAILDRAKAAAAAPPGAPSPGAPSPGASSPGAAAPPAEVPAARAVLSSPQIRRILPHRYPFLLVDRVTEIDGYRRAVGLKNVTVNEPFFTGHYPEEPIMPGVLLVEAMAQLAGILLLRKLELTGKLPVLLSIDRVKFRHAVVPGDQVRLEAVTVRLSGGRGRVQCRATVGGVLASEARLNFAVTEASAP